VTILLVSHDLNLAAEVSDRLLLLAEGRVARLGTPEDVLDESTLAAVFGCEVTVEKNPTTRRPHVQLAWRVEGGERAPRRRENGPDQGKPVSTAESAE